MVRKMLTISAAHPLLAHPVFVPLQHLLISLAAAQNVALPQVRRHTCCATRPSAQQAHSTRPCISLMRRQCQNRMRRCIQHP